MKKYLLLIVFIVNSNFVFSQSDNAFSVLVTFVEYYSMYLYDSYDDATLINDLSYDIKYSGNNIEDGMRQFIEKHPLKFRSSENEKGITGSVEAFRNTYNALIDYLGILKSINNPNTSMIYLAIGWKLLYDYLDINIGMKRALDRYEGKPDVYANIEFQIKSLQTDIVFRANMLSVRTTQGRQYLSLFDNRTYVKYGYFHNQNKASPP